MAGLNAVWINLIKVSGKSYRWVECVTEVMSIISMVILGSLVILTGTDVFLRKLFSKPIVGSYELSEFGFSLVVCLALGYTQLKGMHIRIDLITSHVKGKIANAILDMSAKASLGGFASVITWFSWQHFIDTIHTGEASFGLLRLPWVVPWSALLIGCFMLFTVLIFGMIGDMGAFFACSQGQETNFDVGKEKSPEIKRHK